MSEAVSPTSVVEGVPRLTDEIDVIWGVEDISQTINRNKRQTYWLLEQGHIPARKIGRIWIASRRGLRDFLAA